ncbi:MAG: substrate-binding domain-containing protein, partial [Planctomycetota bacterium]
CYNSPVNNPERGAGYRTALFEKGIEYDSDLVIAQPRSTADMRDSDMDRFADEAVDRFLGLKDPATAIFAFSDTRAVPVMNALKRRGLRAGENYCLAGYGDSAMRRGICDSLTSARIYPRMMGREALKAVLAGGESREGRTLIVPDRLQIRTSTCRPSQHQPTQLRRDCRPPSRRSQ